MHATLLTMNSQQTTINNAGKGIETCQSIFAITVPLPLTI
jgi:hypothetical protein